MFMDSFIPLKFSFQVSVLMEEHTRHLLDVNKKFGNSLLSSVTLSQQSDTFVDEIKVDFLLNNLYCKMIELLLEFKNYADFLFSNGLIKNLEIISDPTST